MRAKPVKAKRFTLSFGAKLVLGMTTVCVVTSVTALLVIRNHFTAIYSSYIEEQLTARLELANAQRTQRLRNIVSLVEEIAADVRTIAAIGAQDAARIYYDVGFGLRRLFNRYAPAISGSENQPFFLFLNPEGQLLQPQEGISGPEQLLNRIASNARGFEVESPSLAYALESDTSPWELVTYPVHDPYGLGFAGHLVIALPLSENSRRNYESVERAFLIGNHVVTGPPLPASFLSESGTERLNTRQLTIEGRPFRARVDNATPDSQFDPAQSVILYPISELASIDEINRLMMLMVIGLSAIAGYAISRYLSKVLTRPIHRLIAATQSVAAGDFTTRIHETQSDEFGDLNRSFNEMTAGLALKERYRSVLDLVSDREVADRLLSGKIELGGEMRTVSMLFCDIRGFTSLTDGMDPQEVIAFVNSHMTEMTRIAKANGGVVDKFVGDEIIVLFGAPRSREDDARRAVNCAIGMLERRQTLNATASQPIQIGIGVATGSVVAGCMGSEDRLNYSVLGDRVNLAARLCSKALPNTILIDDATANALDPSIKLQPMDPIPLKGFAEPVSVHQLSLNTESSA